MPANSPLPAPAHSPSILAALRDASRRAGLKTHIVEDASGATLTYRQLWLRAKLVSDALAKSIAGGAEQSPRVGVMLPSSAAATVTFFALQMAGRVPVMLNVTAGLKANHSAIATATLDHVITSKQFIAKAKLEELIASISNKTTIIYLEDIKDSLSKWQALGKLARLMLGIPQAWIPKTAPESPAVILFTSGSEGAPKGVVLSHRNILSNIAQCGAQLVLTQQDKMFNTLPVFHSFGLTVGTLLPPLLGFSVYHYPSPLQYKQIPGLVAQTNASIFPSTDTFLRGYAAHADAQDFASLRAIVAGAERLKPQTFDTYRDRFGIEILQGYGVTETSPVAAVNTPEAHKQGSVGRLLPGMEAALEPVEGIAKGGALKLKGPNIMLGYMKEDQPGQLQPSNEWHDTGDVVEIDDEGYVFITDRLKRFAKLGGEMVSLAVVESLAAEASEAANHAATAAPDARKGEQVVLLTEDANLSREALIAAAKSQGIAELYIPKKIIYVEAIAVLGSGKTDYAAVKAQALDVLENSLA